MGTVMHGQSFGTVFVSLRHYKKHTHPQQSPRVHRNAEKMIQTTAYKLLCLLAQMQMCHKLEETRSHYIINDAIFWLCS